MRGTTLVEAIYTQKRRMRRGGFRTRPYGVMDGGMASAFVSDWCLAMDW
jgi:hypothetical protein